MKRGVVYIAETIEIDRFPGEPRFTGHWAIADTQPAEFLEEGPGWDTPENAIEWGRARAPIVLIRTGEQSPQIYYSAGEIEPPGETLPRWAS